MTGNVSFGFNYEAGPEAQLSASNVLSAAGLNTLQPTSREGSKASEDAPLVKSKADRDAEAMEGKNVGLGSGVGGQLAKSAFGSGAYTQFTSFEKTRQQRYELPANVLRTRKVTRLNNPAEAEVKQVATPRSASDSLKDGEPQGMFQELLLSDLAWATEPASAEDLAVVRDHRWTFRGAVELAQHNRSYCFFARCLLDMQRNLQCEEEGNALDPRLTTACKMFVSGQCGAGRMGEMYQLLTHFVSNAVIFDEWERYLANAFTNERASQEVFLVPHLEQVWVRFCRMLPTLEEIFDVLNARFVWRHRLPKVGDVVRETMKRRCFSSKAVTMNEMFTQEKCNNETVKNIKRSFGIGM